MNLEYLANLAEVFGMIMVVISSNAKYRGT